MKGTINFALILAILLITSCSQNEESNFNLIKNDLIKAKIVLSTQYPIIIKNIERPNNYTNIISIYPSNFSKIKELSKDQKEAVLNLFYSHKFESIQVLDSTCFLFFKIPKTGFFNSKIQYYCYTRNNRYIDSLSSITGVSVTKKFAEDWIYIVRKSSLAN